MTEEYLQAYKEKMQSVINLIDSMSYERAERYTETELVALKELIKKEKLKNKKVLMKDSVTILKKKITEIRKQIKKTRKNKNTP